MTNIHKAAKQPKQLKLILIITGTFLTFGWTLLLAATTWLTDLPCVISPTSCSQGASLAQVILFGPAVAGAIMLPIGLLYNLRMRREVKLLITLATAGALLFIAFWLLVLAGISIHGLQG